VALGLKSGEQIRSRIWPHSVFSGGECMTRELAVPFRAECAAPSLPEEFPPPAGCADHIPVMKTQCPSALPEEAGVRKIFFLSSICHNVLTSSLTLMLRWAWEE